MNPTYLRQLHASQIFHALRLRPDISQRELGEITSCDKSTVSVVIKRFEALGLIERSQGKPDGQRGRPLEKLRISAQSGLLVGVHLEFEELRIVAASLDGNPIGCIRAPLPSLSDLASKVREGVAELCATLGRPLEEVRAIGVSVPGLVGDHGGLAYSPGLKWTEVAVCDLLKRSLGAPVYVGNDTNGTALAEHMFGKCTHFDDFLLVESGTGVGGALFLDGSVYHGKNGFAGEIGHTKVVKDGRLCSCGAMGCLSAYLSTRSLLRRAAQISPSILSLDELYARALSNDSEVLDILEEAGDFLGVGVANIVNLFNPAAVVLAGALAKLWPYLSRKFHYSLKQNALMASLQQVEIIVSDLSNDETPRGGIALALEGFTSLETPEATPW